MFKRRMRYINKYCNSFIINDVRNLFLVFLGCVGMFGCNLVNPKEQIPTYIKIDSIAFSGGSHKITSAWVYYNNAPVGVFRLPATIPVLADKAGTIQVGPGVTYDGFQDQQSLYPFYAFDTFAITPSPGNVISHTPVSKYTSVTHFPWKEDFETGSDFKVYDTTLTNKIVATTDPANVFEGYGSGYIHVSTSDTLCESISNKGFKIPTGQSYMELDYKSTISLQVGLVAIDVYGTPQKAYQVGIKAHSTWNKFYVGLQTFAGSYPGSTFFVVIKATLDNGQSDGYVWLDNLKVVSY